MKRKTYLLKAFLCILAPANLRFERKEFVFDINGSFFNPPRFFSSHPFEIFNRSLETVFNWISKGGEFFKVKFESICDEPASSYHRFLLHPFMKL